MRVIVDVMSGDRAVPEIMDGVIAASKECGDDFVLVGSENEIKNIIAGYGMDSPRFQTVNAEGVITMEDDPLSAVRKKKDSSMRVALSLLSEGAGDALVSAGNTGALLTGATLYVKRIEGIGRAALGLIIEGKKPFLLIDTGANATVFEEHMELFALMGRVYMQKMYGIAEPAVGMLNIGTEKSKGTPLHISVNQRLTEYPPVHYVGNVEPAAALGGACDVLVSDGFTGNIFLKTIEGCGRLIPDCIMDEMRGNFFGRLYAKSAKNNFNRTRQRFDTTKRGGASILGISKCIIKAHGASDSATVKNAVLEAVRYAKSGVIEGITAAAQELKTHEITQE